MTGRATPFHHAGECVVNHLRPAEGCRGLVTGLASGSGREVVPRFAHNAHITAAMTGGAASNNSRVVICGAGKGHSGLVTGLASGGGREVSGRFAHDTRVAAAVTGRATGHDPNVIHRRARPEGCR
jgi:hypothetical protein